ncbi:MAG: HEAT repeat domain-containing protein [Candidatus Coatesbacteria bacterium]
MDDELPRSIAIPLEALRCAGATPPLDAIDALIEAGEPAAGPLVRLLDETEPDDDDWTPLWAAITLGELRHAPAAPALLRLLALPEGDVLAEAGVEAIAKIGVPALPALLGFAREAREWEARHYAYAAIGLIPGEASFRFLVAALDADPLLWSAIAMALADFGDPRALTHLRRIQGRARKDAEGGEAAQIAEAIEILEGRRPPYPKLHQQSWRDRYAAIFA